MADRTIPYNQLAKAGYNRPINRKHVNEIKRDFHDDMVQPAIVSFRDGKYWIVDHQHQTQAIFELNNSDPNTPIKCDVRTGLTYEQEADLYYRLNVSSKILTFTDKLTGRIEAKDPEALEFRDVVESCGYVIGGNSSKSLRAVNTAWKTFKKDGGKETLATILRLAKACWPDNINGVNTQMLDGLAYFLRVHSDGYQRERFVKALSKVDPKTIINNGTALYKQMDSRAYTKPYCIYTELVKNYNCGLRNKLIPALPRV